MGGDLQHKVVVEGVGHPQPRADIKVQLQQCVVGLVGFAVLVEPDLQWLAQAGQRAVEVVGAGLFKKCPAKTVVAVGLLAAVPPLNEDIVDLCQGVFQAAFALAKALLRVVEGTFRKRGAVHIPRAAG